MAVTIVAVEDPERVRAELEGFKRDGEELRARLPELERDFPNQWVSIKDGRLFHAAELDSMFAEMRLAGVDPAFAPRWFLTSDPPILIL